jgi:hypothetical protein
MHAGKFLEYTYLSKQLYSLCMKRNVFEFIAFEKST